MDADERAKRVVTGRTWDTDIGVSGGSWVAAIAAAIREAEAAALERAGQYRETQGGISRWADATFGPTGSNVRVAARANEEMAELLRALSTDDRHPKAAEEVADTVIILYRLAQRLGVDLHAEIDRKMAVNRARVWKRDGSGHGYHVRTPPEAARE